MSYAFPSEIQNLIQQELASGRYGSEDEVILEALRVLRAHDQRYLSLKRDVEARIDSLERGEGIELEGEEALGSFFDEIEAEVDAEIAASKRLA